MCGHHITGLKYVCTRTHKRAHAHSIFPEEILSFVFDHSCLFSIINNQSNVYAEYRCSCELKQTFIMNHATNKNISGQLHIQRLLILFSFLRPVSHSYNETCHFTRLINRIVSLSLFDLYYFS